MKRHVVVILRLFCLVSCLASTGVWASSFWDRHYISFRWPDDFELDGVLSRSVSAHLDCGRAYFQYGRYVRPTKTPNLRGGGWEYERLTPGGLNPPKDGSLWSRLGFRFVYHPFDKALGYKGAGYNVGLEFPLWLPMLIGAVIPLGWVYRRVRRRRGTTPGGFPIEPPA